MLDLLVRERSGFDIVSAGELFRVLKAGGKPECCTFAGVGKTREEIEYALRQGILSFNVESEAELELINAVARDLNRRAPIALRVNPDVDAGGHKYISTGKSENKFGVGLDRALEVYRAASAMEHIRVRGVQMHIGSQITEAGTVRQGGRQGRARRGGVEEGIRHRVFQHRRRTGDRLQVLAGKRPGSMVASGSRRTRAVADGRAIRRGRRAGAQAAGPAHPAGAGAVHGRQRGRAAEHGAVFENVGPRQTVRDRRCGHERPDPSRALPGVSRGGARARTGSRAIRARPPTWSAPCARAAISSRRRANCRRCARARSSR